ncbi:MAG: endolytic transglycosylase MltG [Solirubrobacteraceae bacterium]
MPERTPEQREQDRLEREARRAKKEGRAAPAPDSAPVPEPPVLPSGPQTPPIQDATPEPAPPATNREWRRAAGEPDPDPPLVRRVEDREPREEVHAAAEPIPAPEPTPAPERRIPPPPPIAGTEQALGTKRVAAGSRIHRPHLPQRRPRSAAAPGPPSSRRTLGRRVGALLALAAVAVVIWFAASLFQPFAGDGGATVVVTIPKGASVSQVGDLLAEKEVIGSSFFFKLRAKLEGKDDQLNSGRITLKRDMSYAAALDGLTQEAKAAPKPTTKLTIPEGRSRDEIADSVKAAGITGNYVTASRSSKTLNPRRYGAPKGATLEGFLFPATYDLKKGDDVNDLVSDQLVAFKRNFDTVDLKRAKSKNLTAYDILVIASMIEREAGIAKDRPLISAVIYNRLKDGMPLGIDATLRFELKNWTDPLKVSELERDSPYNTRTRTGLPPTPIGNPGLSSIEAAAHPAKVDYLFYVVRPCGNGAHNFSSTDAEFQADVDAYNAKREELNGKSPVTCK